MESVRTPSKIHSYLAPDCCGLSRVRALAETLDDFGKMMYVTLEKAPQVSGLGPWMGVVVGEKQVDSDYPEDKKARVPFQFVLIDSNPYDNFSGCFIEYYTLW